VRALALCIVVLVVASLAAAVEPARACSCIQPDPWAILPKADGAFVGRLVSRREIDEGRAVLTFSVEQTVKGRIGGTVEVTTANNGAACGIESPVGQRTGLFLYREGGRWIGHLCWQVAPEDLLAAAALPVPNGRGSVAMFVGGRFGSARTLALDAKGRTLAYGLGAGATTLISPCPGGETVAEIARADTGSDPDVTFELAVREPQTLRLIRRQIVDLPGWRFPLGLQCEDRAGSRIVVFGSWSGDAALRAAIYRFVGDRRMIVWAGTAFLSSLSRDAAYLRAGFRADRMVKVDLRTGRTAELARIRLSPSLVPDATGRLLAGVAYRLDRRSRLFLVDLTTQPRTVRSVPLRGPEEFGDVLWLSSKRLLFVYRREAHVLDLRLRTLTRFRWTGVGGTLVGSTVFGFDDRSLVKARIPSGPQRIVRRLPGRPDVVVAASP
jgi:hypothetical protein